MSTPHGTGGIRGRIAVVLALFMLWGAAQAVAQRNEARPGIPQPDGTIYSVAEADGVLYLGGNFQTIGTHARSRLAAVDLATGAVLDWNPGAPRPVHALAIGGDALYVGMASPSPFGAVVSYRQMGVNRHTGENLDWRPAVHGNVFALAVLGETIYLGGSFLTVEGHPRGYIAAMDRVTGALLDWPARADSHVNALSVLKNAVYAGGRFLQMNHHERHHAASVNRATGTLLDWEPVLDSAVQTMLAHDDMVYLADTSSVRAVAQESGSDDGWSTPISGARALGVAGTILYLGGDFQSVQGTARTGAAALDRRNGALQDWQPVLPTNRSVSALAVTPRAVVLAGAGLLSVHDFDVSIPSGVTGEAFGPDRIDWTWQAGDTGLSGHRVYADAGDGIPSTLRAELPGDATGWAQTDLAANTLYALQVVALDGAQASHPSPVALAWTAARMPLPLVATELGGEIPGLSIDPTDGNPAHTEYALVEQGTGRFVQADGTLGAGTVFQTAADWGVVLVHGLDAGSGYAFAALARNGGAVETPAGPATPLTVPAGAAPRVEEVVALAADPGAPDRADFSVRFSEPVVGFGPDAVLLEHAGTTHGRVDISGGPAEYAVGVSGLRGRGQFRLHVPVESSVRDAVGQALEAGAHSPWMPVVGSRLPAPLARAGVAQPNGNVHAIAEADGVVYIAGGFSTVGGRTRHNLAALDLDSGAVLDWNPGANGGISALLVRGDTLYAGGSFTEVGGAVRRSIAAIDRATGAVLPWECLLEDRVRALAVSHDLVYLGGEYIPTSQFGERRGRFTTVPRDRGQTFENHLAPDRVINSLLLHHDSMYLGGEFTTIWNQPRRRLAEVRLDDFRTVDRMPDVNGVVNALATAEGTLYLGGGFSVVGGETRNRLAALSMADGAVLDWHPDVAGSVSAMEVLGDTVYFGGGFAQVGGQARDRLAAVDRISGTPLAWQPAGPVLSHTMALAVTPRAVIAGGREWLAIHDFGVPAPVDVAVQSVETDRITWTWGSGGAGAPVFRVYADPGAGFPRTTRVDLDADAGVWTYASRVPNTEYAFRVVAVDGVHESLSSPTVPVWTLARPPLAPVVGESHWEAPQVSIAPGDGNPPHTRYAIRETGSGRFVQPDGGLAAEAAFQTAAAWDGVLVRGLEPGTAYAFAVRARNEAGVETAEGPGAPFRTGEATQPVLLDIEPEFTGPSNADQVRFTVRFSEAVTSFTAADLDVMHTGTTHAEVQIADGPETFVVTVAGLGGDGDLRLRVRPEGGLRDLVGLPLAEGGTSAPVRIDRVAPMPVAVFASPATARHGDTVRISFQVSEALASGPEVYINRVGMMWFASEDPHAVDYEVLTGVPLGPVLIQIGLVDALGNRSDTALTDVLRILPPEETEGEGEPEGTEEGEGEAAADPRLPSAVPRPGTWIPNGPVYAVAEANGITYFGGEFTHVGPRSGGLGVYDPGTGAFETPFPIVDGAVDTVISDGAGGWYVGGEFGRVGGTGRVNLARLRADGQLDTAFQPEPDGRVLALALVGDTLYAGGEFTRVGGQQRSRLAALNPETGAATYWNPSANGAVRSLVAREDTVYLAGDFTRVGGTARGPLAAVDRVVGLATPWGADFEANGAIRCMTAADDVLYLGGAFTQVNGAARENVAALELDRGALAAWRPAWSPISPAGSPPIENAVHTLAVSDGNLYVGGLFVADSASGWRFNAAALDRGTGQPTAWAPELNGSVDGLAAFADGVAVVGGFTQVGAREQGLVAVLDGETGAALGPPAAGGANNGAAVVAVAGDRLAIGGSFSMLGGVPRRNAAAIDSASGACVAWDPQVDGPVHALAWSDDAIYLGGDFSAAGGLPRQHLAAVNRAAGAPLAWNPGADGVVRTLAIAEGLVYAGGAFRAAGGAAAGGAVSLDPATGLATGWDPAVDGTVHALVVAGDLVHLGGEFDLVGGQHRSSLAVVHRVTAEVLPPWTQFPAPVWAVAWTPESVYAAWGYGSIGTQHRGFITVLRHDGTTAEPLIPFIDGRVNALAAADGVIYAGGEFTVVADETSIMGEPRRGLTALDAGTGRILDWDPAASGWGAGHSVAALAAAKNLYANAYAAHAIYATRQGVTVGGTYTQGGPPPLALYDFPMPVPTGLVATEVGTDHIDWAWERGGPPTTGFDVYADAGGGRPTTLRAQLPEDARAWTQAGLAPNAPHTIQVAATGTDYDSRRTAAVVRWTLALPPIALVQKSGSNATFACAIGPEDGNPPHTEYAIRELVSGRHVQGDGTLGDTAPFLRASDWGTVAVTGLDEGVPYQFAARARNGEGVETADGPTLAVRLDTTPPLADVVPATTGPTNADLVVFTVAFSEDVHNFSIIDLEIAAEGVTHGEVMISGGPRAYTVTLGGVQGEGWMTLRVRADGTVRDAAGLPLAAEAAGAPVRVDTVPPAFSALEAVPAEAASGTAVLLRFEASEPLAALPEVQVNGAPATHAGGEGLAFGFTVRDNEPVGFAQIHIRGEDAAGNPGEAHADGLLWIAALVPGEGEGEIEGQGDGEGEGAFETEGDAGGEGEAAGEEGESGLPDGAPGCAGCQGCDGGGPLTRALGDWIAMFLGLTTLLATHWLYRGGPALGRVVSPGSRG